MGMEADPIQVSSAPLNSNRETPDIDSSTDDYASRFSGVAGSFFLDVQSRVTLDLIAEWPQSSVLDVGGGHAQIAPVFAGNGHSVTVLGSDASCSTRLDRCDPALGIRFVEGDVVRLPFPDQSFDVVTSFRMVPHLDAWELHLKEMLRVCRKGLIFDYPDIRSFNILYRLLFTLKKRFEKNTRTFACFSRKQIRMALGVRYENVDYRPQFFFPMVVHRKLKSRSLSEGIEAASSGLGLKACFGSQIVVRCRRPSA